MLLIVSGAPLVFVSVRFCTALVVFTVWLPNGAVPGVSVAMLADVIPIAERVTLSGLEAAFETTVSSAVCTPGAVGVNVTRIERLAPPASVPGVPPLVIANGEPAGSVMLVMLRSRGAVVLQRHRLRGAGGAHALAGERRARQHHPRLDRAAAGPCRREPPSAARTPSWSPRSGSSSPARSRPA